MSDITSILRAASREKTDLVLAEFEDSTIRLALNAGLGAILYPMLRKSIDGDSKSATVLLNALHGADLTARVLTAELLDAAEQILRSSTILARSITLLKGIAICEEYYPEPHLRTMGDIDLLIPHEHQPLLESVLTSLGYQQKSESPAEFYKTHHHSMPYFHPEKGIWVEVHTALFPVSLAVANDKLFSDSYVKSQIVPMTFRGVRTNQLSLELQIPYVCAHMGEHLTFARESFAFFDIVYLLTNAGKKCNWDFLLSSLELSTTAGHVYVILSYLVRHRVVTLPLDTLSRLYKAQKNINSVSLFMLHSIVHKYLLNGRPTGRFITPFNAKIIWETLLSPKDANQNLVLVFWNLIFPPGEKNRYSISRLLRRIFSAIGLSRKARAPTS